MCVCAFVCVCVFPYCYAASVTWSSAWWTRLHYTIYRRRRTLCSWHYDRMWSLNFKILTLTVTTNWTTPYKGIMHCLTKVLSETLYVIHSDNHIFFSFLFGGERGNGHNGHFLSFLFTMLENNLWEYRFYYFSMHNCDFQQEVHNKLCADSVSLSLQHWCTLPVCNRLSFFQEWRGNVFSLIVFPSCS